MFWVWLVLIQLFVFTLLVVFLKMLLTQNVTSATAHLHELNQDYNLKVEEANKKKAEIDRYYDETLIKAKADGEKAKVELLREAHTQQEVIINEARQQGEDIIRQAAKAQEMAMAEIESRIEDRAMDRACELAGAVLSDEMGEMLHKLWVKELLKTGLEHAAKLHVPEDFEEVELVTAFPLTDAERAEIEKKLRQGLQREFKVSEKIQPEMIAGLQVRLGSLLIDGSLRHKVKEASRDVKRV